MARNEGVTQRMRLHPLQTDLQRREYEFWISNAGGLFNQRALNIKKCIRNWVISACPWPDLPLFFIPSQVTSFSCTLHLAGKALNRLQNESGDALASLLTKIASKEHISLVLPSLLRPLIASDWFRLLSGCYWQEWRGKTAETMMCLFFGGVEMHLFLDRKYFFFLTQRAANFASLKTNGGVSEREGVKSSCWRVCFKNWEQLNRSH